MTAMIARRTIRDLARQDIARRDDDPEAGTHDAVVEIDGWYRAGVEAGDCGICEAIDALGRTEAARIYAERIARG